MVPANAMPAKVWGLLNCAVERQQDRPWGMVRGILEHVASIEFEEGAREA